ncbi:hypothetical protein JL193_02195 [Polaribacter batillariae]|uniref:Uncharacterized protein n=1 Tax=Polaribacter batillariae TaxID=2808900 RepID=A0ABX7SV83_9FLAO|nr:hypothetical protein [Polaribacter batillariae]QTD38139.1 hypothetical protein JL193_02195 [Polaribacter batillariae]
MWLPSKIVIDISEVDYESGDDMELLLDIPDSTSSVIILGDKNRKAISTLILGIDAEEDIVDNKFFFDDLEKGIEQLNRK